VAPPRDVTTVTGRGARARPAPPVSAQRLTVAADRLAIAAVVLLVCLLAFVAQGGITLDQNTWAQVLLVAGGALLGAAALALPHRLAPAAPLYGGRALGAFGVLVVLTAASIAWSMDPNSSWLETNRVLSYLAAFGGAIALARLAPARWSAVLSGVGIACVVICTYALATKVFPRWLAEDELAARLRAPFGYWNAVGLMAAMGVPPMLWLAARRSGHAARNALAYPALGVLLVCLLLAYSRGALLALALGLAFWFAVVPLRLRAAAALLAAALTTAGVVAWAFSQEALTEDNITAADRADAGSALGVLLLLQAVVLLGVGLAAGFASTVRPPSQRARRFAGRALVGLVVLALAGGVIALAAAPGGIGGQIDKLTDTRAATPANSPNRLTATASVRARYWDEAFKVHAAQPWLGAGAGAYGTARQRYRTQTVDVAHAHGYVPQVLADLGWAGLAVSLVAAVAWLLGAIAVLGLRRRDRGLPWDAERVGMATLAAVVAVFGVHSFIDWTWFVPANAVTALVCAGWVVARPPLRKRLHDEGPTGIVPAAERAGILPATPSFGLRERMAAWKPSRYRSALALAVLGIGMGTCWSIVQPLRAENAYEAVANRIAAGEYDAAVEIAEIAHDRNPLSVEPWFALAAARTALGDREGTERALVEAVQTQPANSEAWHLLGRYQLRTLGDAAGALKSYQAAFYLDPLAPGRESDVLEAARAVEVASP
jgi:tetratricopeptide (TPR) repeat protein